MPAPTGLPRRAVAGAMEGKLIRFSGGVVDDKDKRPCKWHLVLDGGLVTTGFCMRVG